METTVNSNNEFVLSILNKIIDIIGVMTTPLPPPPPVPDKVDVPTATGPAPDPVEDSLSDAKLRKQEIDDISELWMSRDEMDEATRAINWFGRHASTGGVSGRNVSDTESNTTPVTTMRDEKIADIYPATSIDEAIELVRSHKYKWVYKSAHDGSGDDRCGYMLVPRIVSAIINNATCTAVAEVANVINESTSGETESDFISKSIDPSSPI